MQKIRLSKLIADFTTPESFPDVDVNGVAIDSRKVKPGDLFCALEGMTVNGNNFIDEAIKKGACVILSEKKCETQNTSVPIITISELQKKLGIIIARFFQDPSKYLNVVGVTGTNGKTSYCHFLAKALKTLGHECGLSGTLGKGLLDDMHTTGFTTTDPLTLHQFLKSLLEKDIQHVALEVSSHGLVQHRVAGIQFDIGVFTNLTHEHLDFHGSFEAYGEAKSLLFTAYGIKTAIINLDDPFGETLYQQLPSSIDKYGYSTKQHPLANVFIKEMNTNRTSTKAKIKTPWGEGIFETSLMGEFNLSNLLAVLATLNVFHIPFDLSLSTLRELSPVLGRMQSFQNKNKPLLIVDYAHTPDALEKVLQQLQQYHPKHLYCVFGCGGDRDSTKRPKMGEIAEKYCDHIFLTDDNPRNEDPEKIISHILEGIKNKGKITIESNREKAIQQAIQHASEDDIVLVAGKGHEDYQIIGKEKIPLSDIHIVQNLLGV